MTTNTLTLNDLLVELGSLTDNKDVSIQRIGARMIELFINTYTEDYQVDTETTANLLYYLTDIQVRDYAMGIIDPTKATQQVPALEYLLNAAPTDTTYVNAPAALLAVIEYELGNGAIARLTIAKAAKEYSLAQLLRRVFNAGWASSMFADMRKELHPKVVEGIFGEDN